MNVLWIGYGRIGEPMCRRVAAGGHEIVVLEADEARRAAAQTSGLALAEEGSGAVASDVIVSSLPNEQACQAALAGADGVLARARRGATLIETSTISVAASRAIAEAATRSGIRYLRGPVSGTVNVASAGSLTTYVSGPEDALGNVSPVIACYASKIIWVGPDEQARLVKLAVNLMVSTLLVSLA
jgi:3-hydroxyisobutyrate dehydrogenase-like beta-hydroxyacid dehydrogenase